MDNQQLGNKSSKQEEKMRNFVRFPMQMLLAVASWVAAILAIVMLILFFLYGLETFGLRFW
jgi:hypothetical protein